MTSKIIVNTIEADTGISSVTFASNINLQNDSSILVSSSGVTLGTGSTIAAPSANEITLSTNSAERLRIDSAGRMLLGTTTEGESNADTLTIAESGNAGITIRSGSSAAGSIYFSDATSGGGEYDGWIAYNQNSRYFQFGTAQTERLRITSAGTVNIGDQGLGDEYLSSTVKIRKDQNSVTRLSLRNENSGSGSASAIQVGAHGNSWMLQCGSAANDSNAFTIRVDGTANSNTGTEKLRITTAGNLGIGGLTNPGALLSIPAGESNTPRLAIESAVDDNDFTITQYEDGNGTYTMLGQNVKLNSGGNNTILDSGHRTAGILLDARNHGAITFLTGGTNSVSEPVKITSAGTLESYSPDDTTPNIKWRSNDANWFGALNQSVEGGSITSFLSCGGDWSANGTTYSATKALAAYPTSAIAIHNQYNSSWGSQFVFLTKAGGSSTTDGAVTERLRVDSSGRLLVGTTSADSNTRLHVSAAENTSDPMTTDASIVIANTQNVGNNEAAALKFNVGNTNTASISAHYDSFSAGVNSSLRFYTQYQSAFNSPTERMRIDPNGRVTMPYQPAFSVRRNSAQDIAHNTNTKVQWNTEIFDVGGNFDSSTNYRFTAPVAGKYLFMGHLYIYSTYQVEAKIYKNGSIYKRFSGPLGTGSNDNPNGMDFMDIVDLSVNDFIEIFALQGRTGDSSTVTIYGGNLKETSFVGYFLG